MTKMIPLSEVKKHTKDQSCWIIIHNDVYDVSQFLCEHPGGADALLEVAGRDGTSAFEDVGHSDDAKELMKKYKIGTLPPADKFSHHSCCTTTSSMKSLSTKSSCSGVPKKVSIHEERKPWRTFDDSSPERSSRSSKTSVKSAEPRIERHISSIVVPRGRVPLFLPGELPPEPSNWWKYALLALAGAIVVGFIIKRQQSK